MLIIVFIQSAVKDGSVDDLIKTKIPIADGSRPPRDPQRDVDFEEEISKEKDDKEYFESPFKEFIKRKREFSSKTLIVRKKENLEIQSELEIKKD